MRNVNDRGLAVGQCTVGGNAGAAFLWHDGTLHDLNDLLVDQQGLTLSNARSILTTMALLRAGRPKVRTKSASYSLRSLPPSETCPATAASISMTCSCCFHDGARAPIASRI